MEMLYIFMGLAGYALAAFFYLERPDLSKEDKELLREAQLEKTVRDTYERQGKLEEWYWVQKVQAEHMENKLKAQKIVENYLNRV